MNAAGDDSDVLEDSCYADGVEMRREIGEVKSRPTGGTARRVTVSVAGGELR
jgi:hypothetical protein